MNATIRKYSSRAFIWVVTPLDLVGQFRISKSILEWKVKGIQEKLIILLCFFIFYSEQLKKEVLICFGSMDSIDRPN